MDCCANFGTWNSQLTKRRTVHINYESSFFCRSMHIPILLSALFPLQNLHTHGQHTTSQAGLSPPSLDCIRPETDDRRDSGDGRP
ncbi:hypothetical protein HanRHA438_Chr14g0676211 [Helianthus annuus]|nr:hypothetical protein HanXRQr2_Chr14g0664971 [Helianthus annuus]KAF5770935.1 hypothetical protein HanXRQr2_Chr14g0664991 [Helianthus annuus]KAF5770936.1 hypothetical protein HanXRQr2_Chr14g0665001 [Helianthus annuus]KAJ0465788.1 hypothetical protein HanHA300_Chr14g0542031 [Helianthus annuus]KAJ0470690.1 hypothetical protein HanIR_Chr14g0721541 [Helianthus annuus]